MSTILLFKDKEVVEGNIDTILHVGVCFQTSYIKETILLKKNGVNIKNIKMCSKEGAKVMETRISSLGQRECGGREVIVMCSALKSSITIRMTIWEMLHVFSFPQIHHTNASRKDYVF